jgi:hypothetical protein
MLSAQQINWPLNAWHRWERAIYLCAVTEWSDSVAVCGLLAEIDDDERLARAIISLARVSERSDLLGVLDEVRRLGTPSASVTFR